MLCIKLIVCVRLCEGLIVPCKKIKYHIIYPVKKKEGNSYEKENELPGYL